MSKQELIAHFLALHGPATGKEAAERLELHPGETARCIRRMHSEKLYGIKRHDNGGRGGRAGVWTVDRAAYEKYLAGRGKTAPTTMPVRLNESLPLPTPAVAAAANVPKLTRWQPTSPYFKPPATKAEAIIAVTENQWWPFARLDGKILEEIDRKKKAAELSAAPEALL